MRTSMENHWKLCRMISHMVKRLRYIGHIANGGKITEPQTRPQGSLLSCAGRIGTPGQSDFKANSYWLLKQRYNNQ